jgi:hypothetical protein
MRSPSVRPAGVEGILRRMLPRSFRRSHCAKNTGARAICWSSHSSRGCQGGERRLAHPSNRLVAQLNESWRVVDDSLQWRLQRKKGSPRKKNPGWQDRSFCTTRDGLVRCIREYCGDVDPAAIEKIDALREHHEEWRAGIQNLDVPGTDQARAESQTKSFVSQELEVKGASNTGFSQPPRLLV